VTPFSWPSQHPCTIASTFVGDSDSFLVQRFLTVDLSLNPLGDNNPIGIHYRPELNTSIVGGRLMALMFPRIARNFMKNGYYPTDEETLSRILNHLSPSSCTGNIRILDPCAGEGVALAECKHNLGVDKVSAYGIEYEKERAWHCKQMLDVAIHGDLQNCIISKRAFGLLWLNPPYGDLVSDNALIGDSTSGRQRLEKMFYQITNGTLQFGGIMVLIIPYTCIDSEFAKLISTHFVSLHVYTAPEQRFKQIVVFGIRRRVSTQLHSNDSNATKAVKKMLERIGKGDLPPELPEVPDISPYIVPSINSPDVSFYYGGMDIEQLEYEIDRLGGTLWSQFDMTFGQSTLPYRPPLRQLSEWHLALVLASGQISGVVNSYDGRVLVVKGDTHKGKRRKTVFEEQEDGRMLEVQISTDIFIPVIRAIDFTEGSSTFGSTFVIQ